MVVVPALGLPARLVGRVEYQNLDCGSRIYSFTAVGIWPYVRKGGLPCFFSVCFGGMYWGYRNPMAPVPYAAGDAAAYSGTVVSRKCYEGRETAGSAAVYSLYYSFFLDGYGVTIFPECNVYLCINSCVFREKVL